jgi:hypothetical protein
MNVDFETPFPLAGDCRPLGDFVVLPGEVLPLRRSGWSRFSLLLADRTGSVGELPAVQGIYSRGGKDGIRPWMDIDYAEDIPMRQGNAPARMVSLAGSGAARDLFRILGEAIPPGGHLMVSYEGDQSVHRETLLSLGLGVPPVATPLGVLLFFGGFPLVKDWYLAEGGMEGPRKLWGEKAPDPEWDRVFRVRTFRQLQEFSSRPRLPDEDPLLAASRVRSSELLALPVIVDPPAIHPVPGTP